MKNQQTKEQDIEKAVSMFRRLITKDYSLESLAERLDEVSVEYAQFLIDQPDAGYTNRSEGYFLLYELRCICQLKDLSPQ
jgi:hypothetical protein